MQQGDYGNQGSEPWAERKRFIPLRTYSGKIKYKLPPSRRHNWGPADVERILNKVVPAEKDDPAQWTDKLIQTLKRATLAMMERMLWFLDASAVESIYDFGTSILDKIFQVPDRSTEENKKTARRIILYIAERAALGIKFLD